MAEEFEPDFDAIVVGCGCAGAVAAYTLASAGKAVLVIERGNYAGAKNMTGGRIYAHSLKKVFPNFEEEAPVQRKITHEKISLIGPESNFTVEYTDPTVLGKEGADSYSVLRGPFDMWLSEKAEEAGAEIIPGIAVEDFMRDDAGKIIGIVAAGEEMTARMVLLCDGANSLLTYKAGLANDTAPSPHEVAVGAKETIELGADVIQDRFGLADGEGAAWMFAGDVTKGAVGGIALYTNEDTVSVAAVTTLAEVAEGNVPVYQMLEDFKNRPEIQPYLKGGKLVEYSGHLVPEGGYASITSLTGDNVLVAGDAAGQCINVGYTVRGMDFAIAAGQMAGEAAVKAIDAGDTSKAGLKSYEDAIFNSFVHKDMEVAKNFPKFLESDQGKIMFNEIPTLVRDIFIQMFSIDGTPQKPIMKKMMPIVKGFGMVKLAKFGMKAVKSL